MNARRGDALARIADIANQGAINDMSERGVIVGWVLTGASSMRFGGHK